MNITNYYNDNRLFYYKNLNTFIKSIKFANKFYSNFVQSYFNYIKTVNKSLIDNLIILFIVKLYDCYL